VAEEGRKERKYGLTMNVQERLKKEKFQELSG
jgi:hypothetical protein